ncbi:hypothetical protein [Microbaculum marinum]|uniref:Sulfotransferase family protein n=1 Tax=Microbaculum marinum TaxID=1764581 RepID=A0AAW9S0V0_9HYPH
MLISERFNFVYLANPKTGTTSIEAAFGKYADYRSASGPRAKHITVRMFKRKFRFFESLEKVVCVRDPISTLHSWYRYRQREIKGRPQNMIPEISFEEFLHHWSQKDPPSFADVSSGIEFVLTRDGKLPDISYFRYEGTPTLHAYLATKVGEVVPEKMLNQSSVPETSTLPDPAELNIPKLDRIYEIYRKIPFRNDGRTLGEMTGGAEVAEEVEKAMGASKRKAGGKAGGKGPKAKRRKQRRAARQASESAGA